MPRPNARSVLRAARILATQTRRCQAPSSCVASTLIVGIVFIPLLGDNSFAQRRPVSGIMSGAFKGGGQS